MILGEKSKGHGTGWMILGEKSRGYSTANQDVHALTKKSSSILPITSSRNNRNYFWIILGEQNRGYRDKVG